MTQGEDKPHVKVQLSDEQQQLDDQLAAAVEKSDLQGIDAAIAQGAQIHQPGHTLLARAVKAGQTAVVRHLLDRGFTLTDEYAVRLEYGLGSLAMAAQDERLEILELLLAQPDASRFLNLPQSECASSASDLTPLAAAAEGCQARVVERLLRAGADVDAWDESHGGPTPLLALLHQIRELKTATLEGSGRDVDEPKLARAFDCLQLLLAAGANPDLPSTLRETPRECAHELIALVDCPELKPLLALPNGGIQQKSSQSEAPAVASALYSQFVDELFGENLQEVQRLIDLGIDLHLPRLNPIANAVLSGNVDVLRLLITQGCTLEAEYSVGRFDLDPPINEAAQSEDTTMLKVLLAMPDAKVYIDVFQSTLDWTALHGATASGNVEAVCLLLAAGANVNAHAGARAGSTPLAIAIDRDHPTIVKLLLEAGADPDIPGWMWITARDRAAKASPEIQSLINAVPAKSKAIYDEYHRCTREGRKFSGLLPYDDFGRPTNPPHHSESQL